MTLEGKVIAVLGASSGIGAGIVRSIAKESPRAIILGARRENMLKELANTLNTETLTVQTDVTSEESLRNFFEIAIKKYGQVDAVINSAGVIQKGNPIEKLHLEEIDRIIYSNLNQTMHVAHYAIPIFKKQGNGIYIVISSQAGTYAFPNETAYCASKAGLDQFIRSLDEEIKAWTKEPRPKGNQIYAFSIAPGFINTEEAKRQFPELAEKIEHATTPDQFGEIVKFFIENPDKKYQEKGPVHLIETLRI